MQDDISELISVIKLASVRDDRYFAAKKDLLRLGSRAVHALTELANGNDVVAVHRAREILAKMPSL